VVVVVEAVRWADAVARAESATTTQTVVLAALNIKI
jgi:hypothetical protein